MSRPLFLHETVDIRGESTWPYMEHTLGAKGSEKINFTLVGTFATMGITGRWPQVVNLWEIPGGWDGWQEAVSRLNLARRSNAALEEWWRTAYEYRSGGIDRLLGGAVGCPTLDQLLAEDIHGELFVHEFAEVPAGGAQEYLDAVRNHRVPLMAEHGHRLVGLYETMLTDSEVITIWATDPASHVAMQRALETGRRIGDAPIDHQLYGWVAMRRQWTSRWREELMTPMPGIPIGPRAAAGSEEPPPEPPTLRPVS